MNGATSAAAAECVEVLSEIYRTRVQTTREADHLHVL